MHVRIDGEYIHRLQLWVHTMRTEKKRRFIWASQKAIKCKGCCRNVFAKAFNDERRIKYLCDCGHENG